MDLQLTGKRALITGGSRGIGLQQFWDAANVKTVGYQRTARAVAPGMVAQGWGRIINVAGLAARGANDFVATARNVGVSALSKNLADELGPHGVNVTVVHPGVTITERTGGSPSWRRSRASRRTKRGGG